MNIVIALGGSIIFPSGADLEFCQKFSKLMIGLHKEGHKIMVITGGGKTAREYISAARRLGASEEVCDELGIMVTRLNAMLLKATLKDYAPDRLAGNYEDACKCRKIFLMGGTKPGQTTDTVSAMLAKHCNADLLVIATNVDGVYDSDPNTNPSAKKFDTITGEKLLELVYRPEYKAGENTIVDPKAVKIIVENGIKTVVLNGRDIESLENAIKGKKHRGTVVV